MAVVCSAYLPYDSLEPSLSKQMVKSLITAGRGICLWVWDVMLTPTVLHGEVQT